MYEREAIFQIKDIIDKAYEEGVHHLDSWSTAYDIVDKLKAGGIKFAESPGRRILSQI